MPPRRKRVKVDKISENNSPREQLNTSGLPSLAAELLLEITSHLTAIPVPTYTFHVLSRDYLAPIQGLRSLSQTCSYLRRVLLPIAWAHLQVCASAEVAPDYSYDNERHHPQHLYRIWDDKLAKYFAWELVEQMETVTVRNESLAEHVRTMSVVLSDYSSASILSEFIHTLSLLPNLKTLQVLRMAQVATWSGVYSRSRSNGWGWISPLKTIIADGSYNFSSIQTLVLHPRALAVAFACPNAKELVVRTDFAKHYRGLSSRPDPDDIVLRALSQMEESLPNLRRFLCTGLKLEEVSDLLEYLPPSIEELGLLRVSTNRLVEPDDSWMPIATPVSEQDHLDFAAQLVAGLPALRRVHFALKAQQKDEQQCWRRMEKAALATRQALCAKRRLDPKDVYVTVRREAYGTTGFEMRESRLHLLLTTTPLPQELLEDIIENIAPLGDLTKHPDEVFHNEERVAMLRSCALVSRAFLRPCQLRLFGAIGSNGPEDADGADPAYALFAALIDERPHVLSYVRHMHLVYGIGDAAP
ncbi:hypothetical protein MKEN_00482400 [Mycena kentingensis (nom. inval.)]|nr:hypothetical protein MKEN_00482400 [Mycena kentingensis (nom. inval.)]